MPNVRYQALGPLLAGEGSRAFLGLEIVDDKQTQPVVIIWLPDEVIGDSELLVRVTRETARATTLEHPNILRVLGLEKVDGKLARIVEFADGESLRLLLETVKSLPADVASSIVCNVAMGVHFAHMAGNDDGTPLIHGDIRPETVMIAHSGLCKVTGYGALTVAPKEADGKRVRGRRIYAAPEQILGGREALNRQTDVFLLGLMLYECLTGQRPFSGEAEPDQAILSKALSVEIDAVPENLRLIIARATAKRASDRYPTALDLKDALERARPSLPTQEEFAAYLATHFASTQSARSARASEIESGVADVPPKPESGNVLPAPETRPAAGEDHAAITQPAPKTPASADTSVTQPAPASPKVLSAKMSPPPPIGAPAKSLNVGRKRKSRGVPWPTVVALLLAIVAMAVLWTRGDEIIGGLSTTASIGRDAVRSAIPQPLQSKVATTVPSGAETPAPDVARAQQAQTHPSPGPTAAAALPKPTPQLPAIAPPSVSSVELVIDPPVFVTVDGTPAGKSPVTLPLAAGRHKLQLVDRKKGINVTRTLEVGGKGRTRQQIVLGSGYVSVSAPRGAVINIDGKTIGEAPVSSEISIFEGSHHILVTMGSAKWQQAFQVKRDEHAYFNVEVRDQ